MANKKAIFTEKAPLPIGPYSQAMQAGDLIFVSGQIGINPSSGELITQNVATEAEQTLQNLIAVLQAAGCEIENVVKTTVYLTNMDDFHAVNTVYSRYFSNHKPARSCLEVAALPKGARIEIEAVATSKMRSMGSS